MKGKVSVAFGLLIFMLGCKGAAPIATSQITQISTFSEEFDSNDDDNGIFGSNNWTRSTGVLNNTKMRTSHADVSEGFLHIITGNYGSQYQGGAIETRDSDFEYGRWDARLRPSEEPGVVNTMLIDGSSLALSDQELPSLSVSLDFLSYTFRGQVGEAHIAIHRGRHEKYFSHTVPLSFNPSKEFHVWSIEILPGQIRWLVDGDELARYIIEDDFVAEGPLKLAFQGHTSANSWVKGPPQGLAHYYIDWVKFYPLTE